MGQFQKWTFGNTEVIALQDTWSRLRPDYFFPDADPAAFGRYGEHLMDGGRMALSHTAWLIASGGRTILVDTGVGFRPGPLPVREEASLPTVLVEAGVRADEVDTVVFTHLHYDHVGWNTVERDGAPAPLFPNARHIVQQREWDYWASPEANPMAAPDRAAVLDPLLERGLVDFVEGEHAVTREVVTVPTPGHTPGHVSFLLTAPGQSVLFLGDAAHSPMQVTEAHWCAGADLDPETARASRRMLWDRSAREGALVASNHFPFPGLGRVVEEGGVRRWEARAGDG